MNTTQLSFLLIAIGAPCTGALHAPATQHSDHVALELYIRDTSARGNHDIPVVIRVRNNSSVLMRLNPAIGVRAYSLDSSGHRAEAQYLPRRVPSATQPVTFGGAKLHAAVDIGVDWEGLPRLILIVETDSLVELREQIKLGARSENIEELFLPSRLPILKLVTIPRWCITGDRLKVRAVLEDSAGNQLAESNLHEVRIAG